MYSKELWIILTCLSTAVLSHIEWTGQCLVTPIERQQCKHMLVNLILTDLSKLPCGATECNCTFSGSAFRYITYFYVNTGGVLSLDISQLSNDSVRRQLQPGGKNYPSQLTRYKRLSFFINSTYAQSWDNLQICLAPSRVRDHSFFSVNVSCHGFPSLKTIFNPLAGNCSFTKNMNDTTSTSFEGTTPQDTVTLKPGKPGPVQPGNSDGAGNSDGDGNGSNNLGLIIGAVVGTLVVICIVLAIFFCLRKRRRQKEEALIKTQMKLGSIRHTVMKDHQGAQAAGDTEYNLPQSPLIRSPVPAEDNGTYDICDDYNSNYATVDMGDNSLIKSDRPSSFKPGQSYTKSVMPPPNNLEIDRQGPVDPNVIYSQVIKKDPNKLVFEENVLYE